EIPKNISYGKYCSIQDWVYMRESVDDSMTLAGWLNSRPSDTAIASAEDWLDTERWTEIKGRYKAIIEKDLVAAKPGMGMDDWNYFKDGIENLGEDHGDLRLTKAIIKQVDIVNSNGLDKYVNLFTILGLVLIGISILVAILSKPLKKLMHSVN